MRRAGLLVMAFFSSTILSGCIPGITHTKEVFYEITIGDPILGPDGVRYVYPLVIEEWRLPIGIATWPNGGGPMIEARRIEVYVGNCNVKNAPQLVYGGYTNHLLASHCYWDSSGIYVRTVDADGKRYLRIDPTNWKASPSSDSAGDFVFRTHDEIQTRSVTDWNSVGHVLERWGQIFYWHPDTYTKDLLFEMPATHEGHRLRPIVVEGWSRYRPRDAYDDAIHRLRLVRGTLDGDTLRVAVQTYVPRPGASTRAYSIDYAFKDFEQAPADSLERAKQGIVRTMEIIGPEGAVIHANIPLKRLLGVGLRGGTVFVRLRKVAEPSDSTIPEGIATHGDHWFGSVYRKGQRPRPHAWGKSESR